MDRIAAGKATCAVNVTNSSAVDECEGHRLSVVLPLPHPSPRQCLTLRNFAALFLRYIADVLNETHTKGYDGILFDIEASCARAGKTLPNGTVPWTHMPALTDALIKTADAMHAGNKCSDPKQRARLTPKLGAHWSYT